MITPFSTVFRKIKIRRLLSAVGMNLGLVAGVVTPAASAQFVDQSAAPAAWVAYAALVNQEITRQLGGSDPAAVRLRAYIDQIPGPTANERARLPIKVWVDRKGVIEKIDFTPFADPQPNADLQALLIGRNLSAAPPKNMLLPIRLTIGLEPAPQEAAPTGRTH